MFHASDSTWYCNSPLGKNSLAELMAEISKIAHLSTIYTNHSVRATSITVMDIGGITGRHIMKVSGHRSEASLKSYSNRVSDRKKREISDILSNAITSVVENETVPEIRNTTCTINNKENIPENQPIPPEELFDIFANDIELEEVDENLISDPQLNTIMKDLNPNNNTRIQPQAQPHGSVNLQMNKTNNNLNQIECCGSRGIFSFIPKFQNCSVNITVHNNQAK